MDRSAVQWLKLAVAPGTYRLTYAEHGRIADLNPTAPYFYYYPSLMVNASGDVLVGCSGSSVNSYINAYYSFKSSGEEFDSPVCIRTGQGFYDDQSWGDYSYTSLDPLDCLSFWTVQEYAGNPPNPLGFLWKTVISEIRIQR